MNFKNKHIASIMTMCGLLVGASSVQADIYNPDKYLTKGLPSPFNINAVDDAVTEAKYFNLVVSETYKSKNPALIGHPELLTLDDWKTYNGFGSFPNGIAKSPAVQGYYYNSADLGLMRNMNCVQQFDGPIRGQFPMACFVSNSGFLGGNLGDGIFQTLHGGLPFATVAMEFWPGNDSAGAIANSDKNAVRFFVFDENGKLVYKPAANASVPSVIKLDTGNGHSQPGICMACHGGKFVMGSDGKPTGEIVNAHFLPFDTALMELPGNAKGTPTENSLFPSRQVAISSFNQMNYWMTLAETQNNYQEDPVTGLAANTPQSEVWLQLQEQYGTAGTYAVSNNVPNHFNSGVGSTMTQLDILPKAWIGQENLYKQVIRPYCLGCHVTSNVKLENSPLVRGIICNQQDGNPLTATQPSNMPQAEVNQHNLLRHAEFIRPVLSSSLNGLCEVPSLIDFNAVTKDYNSAHLFGVAAVSKVIDPNNIVRKRTFQTTTDTSGTIGIINIGESQYPAFETTTRLKRLSFSYFLEGNNNSIEVQFVSRVGNSDVVKTQFFTVPVTGFTKVEMSVDNSNPDLRIPANAYKASFVLRRNGQAGTRIELDDVLYYIDNDTLTAANTSGTTANVVQLIDFETYDETKPLVDVIPSIISSPAMVNAAKNTSSVDDACRTLRSGKGLTGSAAQQWSRSAEIKVGGDAGTHSYATSPFSCGGDLQSFTIKLTGPSNGTTAVDFDFRRPLNQTLNLTITSPGNAALAIPSENLTGIRDDVFNYENGHRSRLVPSNAELVFSYVVPSSTTAGFDGNGAAIDNIRIINYPVSASSTPSSSSSSSVAPVPLKTIEAEAFSQQSGVQTETTTDVGGGLDVKSIDTGDWISFQNSPVTIPTTGTYTIEYRVASVSSGGSLRFEEAGGATSYGTLSFTASGGAQTWKTVKHTVTLTAGVHKFGINATLGGWSLNWFRITPGAI